MKLMLVSCIVSLRSGYWLTFSQGLRNAKYTQTLDLVDIYGMFVCEDNLIQRRYYDTKKDLITTPSSTAISTAFFSNNVVQDFQENYDDEVDERSSEENLRDLDIEFHERALLENSKCFIKRRNNFSSQKENENTECFKCGKKSSSSQAISKVQKYYKAEYKKMKAKLALLEADKSLDLSILNYLAYTSVFRLHGLLVVGDRMEFSRGQVLLCACVEIICALSLRFVQFALLAIEDPHEAIRKACLVETDTESEPFEDPTETETPESPHTVASLTSLPDSTPPTCHAEESKDSDSTARMAVRVLHAMSPGLSASIAEVAAMSDSAFRKRFRSSYANSPSSSPPDLPSRKRSRGTSKLVEDEEEEDEEEDDVELEESLDSDSKSEDVEEEGPTVRDEGSAAGDEGLAARDEGPGIRVESLGLGGDEAIHEGQQRATLVVVTAVGEPLGLGYGALRHREIASREGQMPSVFEVGQGSGSVPEPERPERTPPSLKWSSGSLYVSPAPSTVLSPILSPMISLTIPSPVASLVTAEDDGFLIKLGTQFEMQGGLIHDHTVRLGDLSPALFERYYRDIGELFTRSGAVRDEIFS
nr:hypothetical protein [Tanacetum cinerariifolium]